MPNVFLFCPKPDEAVHQLAKGLGASILRMFDGMNFWEKGRRYSLGENDAIVCWGGTVPELDGIRVLNSYMNTLTFKDVALKLERIGVPTMGYSTNQSPAMMEPYRKDGSWLARDYKHVAGSDLLHGSEKLEYWTRKENLSEEYRIHSFNGRSIRAGLRVPIPGWKEAASHALWVPGTVHPWIRTSLGGWRLDYSEFKSTAQLRQLAHKVLKSFGLVFGCVDIAKYTYERPAGQPPAYMVSGVRIMPDLPDQIAIDAYSKHIRSWLDGDVKPLKAVPDGDEILF